MDQSNTSSEDDTEEFPLDFENVEVVEPTIVPIGDVQSFEHERNSIAGIALEGFDGWNDAPSRPSDGENVARDFALNHSWDPNDCEATITHSLSSPKNTASW